MSEASGVFRLGENWASSFVLARRFFGWRQLVSWGLLVAYLVGLPFVKALLDLVPVPRQYAYVFGLCGIIVYAVGVMALWITVRRRLSIKILESRGVPNPLVTTFAATPAGMIISTALGETRVNWSAVSELIKTRRYWLIVGGSLGYSLPRRFFDSPETERAFIAVVTGQLSDAALKRSRKALANI